MIEKPPTVLALFEGHPERWTQGAFACTAEGRSLWHADTFYQGNCFCLSGAIAYVYGDPIASGATWLRLRKYLGVTPSDFNDKPERTFDEIVEACRAAGI